MSLSGRLFSFALILVPPRLYPRINGNDSVSDHLFIDERVAFLQLFNTLP